MNIINADPNYPFARLDKLAEVTLNPQSTDYKILDAGQLTALTAQFSAELERVLLLLKGQSFRIFSTAELQGIIALYLESLALLQEQLNANLLQYPEGSLLIQITELLLLRIEEVRQRIEKRYGRHLSTKPQLPAPPVSGYQFKVLVKLSVDQIAVILKAADEAKVLMARSLSAVFRHIMPFISTEKRKEVSWKSARTSTYKFEESDKSTAIAVLEELIRRIRKF